MPVLAQVVKAALKPLDLQQTKDIETAIAGIRSDKVKEKAAADAAKKGACLSLMPLCPPEHLLCCLQKEKCLSPTKRPVPLHALCKPHALRHVACSLTPVPCPEFLSAGKAHHAFFVSIGMKY